MTEATTVSPAPAPAAPKAPEAPVAPVAPVAVDAPKAPAAPLFPVPSEPPPAPTTVADEGTPVWKSTRMDNDELRRQRNAVREAADTAACTTALTLAALNSVSRVQEVGYLTTASWAKLVNQALQSESVEDAKAWLDLSNSLLDPLEKAINNMNSAVDRLKPSVS